MNLKSILMAGSIAAALIAAPALGAQLRGEVVAVGPNTITIMSGGETVTLMVPGSVEAENSAQQKIDVAKLRSGQRVVLTIDENAQDASQKPTVRDIIVEGDLNVDSDIESGSD